MKQSLALGLACLLLNLHLSAQQSCPNSGESIYAGIEQHDNGNYREALEFYSEVSPSDTNAYFAIYEKALTLNSMEKFRQAADLILPVIDDFRLDRANSFVALGNAYDGLEMPDSAIFYYNKGLEDFPINHLLYFNRAVTYEGLGEVEKALADYKAAITRNPYHAGSHLHLGLLAANEGKLTQAMLSWCTFLYLEPSSGRSNTILVWLDQLVGASWDQDSAGLNLGGTDADDFEDLDVIIDQRVALNKKYKYPYKKLNESVCRQVYLMIQELRFDESDQGFWMQTYVPMFMAMNAMNKTEAAIYSLLITAGAYESQLMKKKSSIIDFLSWFDDNWSEFHSKKTFPTTEGDQMKNLFYYNSGQVYGTGQIKNESIDGPAEFYHTNGNLASKGEYKLGKRSGEWYFYHENGNVSQHFYYLNDEPEGAFEIYHENGMISMHGTLENGSLDGLIYYYTEEGFNNVSMEFEDGEANGMRRSYFWNGQVKEEETYVGGMITGSVKRYYPTGALYEESTWKDDLYEGKVTRYFEAGQIMMEGNYSAGELDGDYTEYFPDGSVQEKATYAEGILIGTSESRYINGVLRERTVNDQEKNLTGVTEEFDLDGNLVSRNELRKSEIISYACYDYAGNLLSEGKKQGGKFFYEGFRGDGSKSGEGYYKPGEEGKTGTWKYFNHNGRLTSEVSYEDNLSVGKWIEYYPDGTLSFEGDQEAGENVGETRYYHPNGKLKRVGMYDAGLACGTWFEYYPDGETIEYETYYIDGERNGWRLNYDAKGRLAMRDYFNMGIRTQTQYFDSLGNKYFEFATDSGRVTVEIPNHLGGKDGVLSYVNHHAEGSFVWYFPNGKLSSRTNYLNDERHGLYESWYWNGNPSEKGTYTMGDRHGVWTDYHENGQVNYTQEYLFGEREGMYYSFYQNGKKETEIPYRSDMRHGEAKYYSADGELQMMRRYYHDKILAVGWMVNGEVFWQELENETGVIKAKHDNGRPSREFEIDRGLFQGVYKKYYSTGVIYEETTYVDDKRDGASKLYYPSGKLRYVIEYDDDVRSGSEIWYHENGKVERQRNWLNDDTTGEEKFFDKNGKLIRTIVWRNSSIIEIR